MPYNNSYNQEIANEILNINRRFLTHIKEEDMAPYIEGGNSQKQEEEYEEVHKKEGKGIISGLVGMLGLGKDQEDEKMAMEIKGLKDKVKKGRGRPKKEGKGIISGIIGMLGLGKEGEKEKLEKMIEMKKEENKKKGRGRPKKEAGSKAFLTSQEKLNKIVSQGGAKKQSKKAKEDEKLSMEIKGVKDAVKKGRGRPKKGKGLTDCCNEQTREDCKDCTDETKCCCCLSKEGYKGYHPKSKEEPLLKVPTVSKMEGKGIISGIVGMLGLGKEKKEAGVAEYKKGGSANPRKIGGRKLLSKAEMPPSQMSGNGASGGKKETWQECIKRVKKENPTLKGLKEVLKKAKEEYKK
jgi:hypothetical protein